MSATTPEAARMGEIVEANAGVLRALGFRKRRHSFNRRLDSGLVQVVFFWQAPKEPPAWAEIPGLRERRYGQFRLDFGVYVPEMNRTNTPRSDWINEYDCSIRASIGQLMTGEWHDLWWDLHDPGAEQTAAAALQEHGLPWLDGFPDQESIISAFRRGGVAALWGHPALPLDIATLLMNLDRAGEAREVVTAYVQEPHRVNHVGYLTSWLERSGYADLVPSVVTDDRPPRSSTG